MSRREQEINVKARTNRHEQQYVLALVCGTILVICGLIVLAPHGDRLLLLTRELSDIIVIRGIGGAFNTIFTTGAMAIERLYADFSVHKLVLFVAVAVIVKQFPWLADNWLAFCQNRQSKVRGV